MRTTQLDQGGTMAVSGFYDQVAVGVNFSLAVAFPGVPYSVTRTGVGVFVVRFSGWRIDRAVATGAGASQFVTATVQAAGSEVAFGIRTNAGALVDSALTFSATIRKVTA